MKETNIQRTILDGLAYMGILAWRNQSIPVPIRRGRQIIGLRRADPNTIGMPDIFAVVKGKIIGIEVKNEKGRQSIDQKNWEERLRKAGAIYILARRWEDIKPVFEP